MSEDVLGSHVDPWAWLHTIDTKAAPNYSSFHVVAGVLPVLGGPFTGRCREAVEESEANVEEIRDDLPADEAARTVNQ